MIATHMAYQLKIEGNEVRLFIDDDDRKENFDGLVEKTTDWKKDIDWVGKEGLIVFDDVGYGLEQDELRKDGFCVFGGCVKGDKLESNRQYAQEVFAECGIKTVPIKDFKSIPDAIYFIKQNSGAWVIKQNGMASKSLNYVARFDDSRDVINLLENYSLKPKWQTRTITLQQRIEGVEIGVGRFFNGHDWVGPIELNIEHKKFFPGDLGPTTSEMGTLAWYSNNENNKLFRETLARLKPHLKKINYRGDIEINCIVNDTGAYPLEATPRFGSPIIYLQMELHKSSWGKFLKAIAMGQDFKLKYKRGYGIVVLVTVPPFPYAKKLKDLSSRGVNIYFNKSLERKNFKHVYFEGIALKNDNKKKQYYVSDDQGYVLYVTAVELSVKSARRKIENTLKFIYIPKMFYRNDIGLNFIKNNLRKLKKLGYVSTWWPFLR